MTKEKECPASFYLEISLAIAWKSQFIKASILSQFSMPDAYVELEDIPVMRVRADMKGGGPAAAMSLLESKIPTLKGRKFYGIFRVRSDGEEYYACVTRVETDDPLTMGLEAEVIPGGRFARRRILNWEAIIRDGQLPRLSQEFVSAHAHEADPNRFTLEFYRSQAELLLLVPVSIPSSNDR
jgi:hypothetical protein